MSAVYDYGQRQKEEGIKEGLKEGIKEGIKEGKLEESKKMAAYMIKKGETDEVIEKETVLSLEEIKKIRNDLKL